MNFLARVASLVLSPKQADAFLNQLKTELYSNKSSVELWRQWIAEPTKRRAIAFAEHPTIKSFAESKVGVPLVNLGRKTVGAIQGTPAGSSIPFRALVPAVSHAVLFQLPVMPSLRSATSQRTPSALPF